MNKNLLSVIIIILAVSILIVNFFKEPQSEVSTNESSSSQITVSTEPELVEVGQLAPDFNLTTLNGENVKLSDYKGKTVILNFWATWCPPCKAEMPHMQNFHESHKDNGIEIVAVNLTNMDNGIAEIEKFVKDYGFTFTIPLDKDGAIGLKYQAYTIPTTYVLDSSGVVAKKMIGPMDQEMMETLIEGVN